MLEDKNGRGQTTFSLEIGKKFNFSKIYRQIFFIIKTKSFMNFFELKKVWLIQENILWSKEIDLFRLKKKLLNLQNFL